MIYLITMIIIYGLAVWVGWELRDVFNNNNFIKGRK